jgi:hypothetical protein
MKRNNPNFTVHFNQAVEEIKVLVSGNDHTVALIVARDFIEGPSPESAVARADRTMLNAIAELQNAMGHLSPAANTMRNELARRISDRAKAEGYTVAELRALNLPCSDTFTEIVTKASPRRR